MTLLTQRYASKIRGQLSCYDRIVIQGTLPSLCYAQGMTAYLKFNHIRIFDYPRFAESLPDQLKDNAEKIAQAKGTGKLYSTHIIVHAMKRCIN